MTINNSNPICQPNYGCKLTMQTDNKDARLVAPIQ